MIPQASYAAPNQGPIAPHSQRLSSHGLNWASFWQQLEQRLRDEGYKPATVRLYRQVLRDLRRFLCDRYGITRPDGLTVETAGSFQNHLSEKNVSWSWMATAIAVMRTCFDRYGGLQVTARMQTPRRTWPLPEILNDQELWLLLNSLSNPRDRLLVALLSGCGLRVSEACRIRWTDFNRETATLQITDPSGLRTRTVAVPQGLHPLFKGLATVSRRSDPMICGFRNGATPAPLSPRQAERIVQSAGLRAGILKRVTPMGLRHTYAVRRLAAGENIRLVQRSLGHHCIKTTLRYQACILPKTTSPVDPPPPNLAMKELSAVLDGLKTVLTRMQASASPCGP